MSDEEKTTLILEKLTEKVGTLIQLGNLCRDFETLRKCKSFLSFYV